MIKYIYKGSNIVRRLAALLISLALLCPLLSLSGCSGEVFNIYFGVDSEPRNLDPQMAESYGELLAVRNCFRGLIKEDIDGNAVLDLAESCDISEDRLTYTFKLKDAEWKNGTPVTADDFVFALTRAVDPVTASPSSQALINIVGASARISGDSTAVFGVTATDEKALIINLVRPDSTFLLSLTAAVFKPCNREFFENCGGKYGLSKEHILTNGQYTVSQWTKGRHVKLTSTDKSDTESGKPQNVYITVSATGKNCIQRIMDGEIGMTVDNCNDHTAVNTSKYTVLTAHEKTYALIFNKNTDVGKSKLLTDAFARAVHKEYYSSRMSDRFKTAQSVLPEDSTVLYRTVGDISVPDYGYQFDSNTARNDLLTAVSALKDKKLPAISILYCDNAEIRSILGDVVSQWQSNLGAYVNIASVPSEKKLLESISANEYTVAIVPLSGTVAEILTNFATQNSGMYLQNEDYNNAIKKLTETDDYAVATTAIENCLEILSNESAVIPVISVPTAYIYDKTYKNVKFSITDNTVDFSIIYK